MTTKNKVQAILSVFTAPFTKKREVSDIIAPFGTMLAELQDAVAANTVARQELADKANQVEEMQRASIAEINDIYQTATNELYNKLVEDTSKVDTAAQSEQVDIYNAATAVQRQIDQAKRFIPKLEAFLD